MKKEVSPVVVVVALVVMVAVIVGGYIYYASPHTPAGFKYTPGVPPWKEKGAAPYKPTPDYPASPGGTATQSAATPAAPPAMGRKP
ncbi:MAG TPA: hypothetical protein VFB21_16540 [Chthonomonadaceae bacterium]|nr:hypothetical protein [Chthonomonadaceae bacterium]